MSVSGGVPATLAVIAAKQRRELLARFRERGALSPATALPPEELELPNPALLRGQIRSGAVVETSDGRCYLDREALARYEYSRQGLLLVLLATLILLLFILLFSA